MKLFEVDLDTAVESRGRSEALFRLVVGLTSLLRLGDDLLGLIHLVGDADGLIGLRFDYLRNGVRTLLRTYDVRGHLLR